MKTYKYIALAALALGFTACSQDDDFAPQQEDIVKIASANIATEVQTRVNTLDDGTTWENGDRILLVNNCRNDKKSGTYEATVTTSTTWTLKDGLVLYHSSDANDFTAYYPAVTESDYTLPADQSTTDGIKSADRMVATADDIAKGAAVALSFVRQNAMVTITPNFNTEFGNDAVISSLKIAGITPYHPRDAKDYKAIIAPSTETEKGFTVTLTVGEQTLTAITSTVIEAGKHYSFNLTVGKTAVGINSVSVTDWSERIISDVESEEDLSSIDATAMTSADDLKTAVAKSLAAGETDLTITLVADAPAEMITAIRRAICDTEGVADGSINLTLRGVTSIPDDNYDGTAFGMRNAQFDENNVVIVPEERVTQLASINLPDVLTIGHQAFIYCKKLVSVAAPKVQTIGGEYVFGYTALTSVEFPELTTITPFMFMGTNALSSAKFPKVTTIESGGLTIGYGFAPVNNSTPFSLELTAEGNITFNQENHFNVASQNYCSKVDLVLHGNKQNNVTSNDDGTATWHVRDDLSYTFKSITFVGEEAATE